MPLSENRGWHKLFDLVVRALVFIMKLGIVEKKKPSEEGK